jgi:hypothetical protein
MKKYYIGIMIHLDKLLKHQLSFYELGDKRLNARCEKIHSNISNHGANNSFPEIFKDCHQLKALYNFMNNKKVTPKKLQLGITKGLINYFSNEDNLLHHFVEDGLPNYLYNVQDTTYGKYHGRKSLELGYIETLHDNGIVIHNDVLMDGHHIPLALSNQQFIIRNKSEFGKSKKRKSLPFEQKESYKWIKGIDWATEFTKQATKQLANTSFEVVQIADREADIADWYNYAFEKAALFIVRLNHNRLLKDKTQKVKDYIRTQTPKFQVVRPIVDKNGKVHQINCSVSFEKVSLKKLEQPVWVVHLRALETVINLEETEWFLITNLPLELPNVIINKMPMLVIEAYTKRWRTVEDFHKCLKTGCAIEKRQFESPYALKNMIAIMSIHAIRLLRLRHLADTKQDQPVQHILTQQETEVTKVLADKYLKPSDLEDALPESILWFVLLLGRMGGHQGYRRSGLPGWQTLFKGYLYFQNILEGIIISKNFFHKPPS